MPIISSPTTTPSGIRPATRCWSGSPSASRIRCAAPAIAPRVTAARNLRCCCRGSRRRRRMTVAETIRLKVQQWSGDPPVTTVSIGVASLTPVTSMRLVRTGQRRRQGAVRRQGQRPQPNRAGADAEAVAGGVRNRHPSDAKHRTTMCIAIGIRDALMREAAVTSPDMPSSRRAGRRADRRGPCRRRCWRAGSRPWSRNRAARPRIRRRRSFWVLASPIMASVSWISPPAPRSCVSRILKISGCRM